MKNLKIFILVIIIQISIFIIFITPSRKEYDNLKASVSLLHNNCIKMMLAKKLDLKVVSVSSHAYNHIKGFFTFSAVETKGPPIQINSNDSSLGLWRIGKYVYFTWRIGSDVQRHNGSFFINDGDFIRKDSASLDIKIYNSKMQFRKIVNYKNVL